MGLGDAVEVAPLNRTLIGVEPGGGSLTLGDLEDDRLTQLSRDLATVKGGEGEATVHSSSAGGEWPGC